MTQAQHTEAQADPKHCPFCGAAAGKDGHERARAQRAAVASATGDQARTMRGKRELRAALENLSECSPVRATLLWVLGEVEALP